MKFTIAHPVPVLLIHWIFIMIFTISKKMIMYDDIFVLSVAVQKSAGNGAKTDESKLFIKPEGGGIALDNRIELKNPEAKFCAFFHAVPNKRLPDMLSPSVGVHRIAGVADMPATSDIIGMQDVQSHDVSGFAVPGNPRIGLLREEPVPLYIPSAETPLHPPPPGSRSGLHLRHPRAGTFSLQSFFFFF